MLVGNKIDLVEENGGNEIREVSKEAGEHFARMNRLFFTETSAKNSKNVKEAFENLLQEIHSMRSKMPK